MLLEYFILAHGLLKDLIYHSRYIQRFTACGDLERT